MLSSIRSFIRCMCLGIVFFTVAQREEKELLDLVCVGAVDGYIAGCIGGS